MIVLAIDPGLRNLAYCLLQDGNVRELHKTDIFGGAPIQSTFAFDAISSFCDRIQALFDMADIVVIERQFVDSKIKLSSCLCIVQTVVQCRAYRKHILVHAGTIKKVYGTHRENHRQNKIAAVQKASELNPLLFSGMGGKVDDLADAYLLALYAHNHHTPRVRESPEPGEIV